VTRRFGVCPSDKTSVLIRPTRTKAFPNDFVDAPPRRGKGLYRAKHPFEVGKRMARRVYFPHKQIPTFAGGYRNRLAAIGHLSREAKIALK